MSSTIFRFLSSVIENEFQLQVQMVCQTFFVKVKIIVDKGGLDCYTDFAMKNTKAHEELFAKAHAAGMAAGNASVPTPMIVGTPTTLFGDVIDTTKKTYFVEGGVCGFASVIVKPATSSFARWLAKTGKGRKHYYGGLNIWVSGFGQSLTRKEAYASAFARVLNDAGIKAYVDSRMD